MTLQEKLHEDYKAAMKSGNKLRVETLRLLRAQLKDDQINKMRALTPEEVIAVLSTAAKKRREAIEVFKQGGRDDLLEKEMTELAVMADYLAKAVATEELHQIIGTAI